MTEREALSLAQMNGSTISAIKQISPENYNEYSVHRDTVLGFMRDLELIRCVWDNYADFANHLHDTALAQAESEHMINPYFHPSIARHLNRLTLNLLTSVRTFLDHTLSSFSHNYGKDSPQLNYYHEVTREEFDKHFAYRFMYKLRNYSQHCGMPPINFSMTRSKDIESQTININLSFDRDVLLNSYDSWSIVKTDLEKCEPFFDAIPLINQYIKSITVIYYRLYAYVNGQNCSLSKNWICQFLNDDNPGDFYCIVRFNEQQIDSGLKLGIEWVPAQGVRGIIDVENAILATIK